jgi:hypothetical protein
MRQPQTYPKVLYSVTRLGGGQTPQGVSFPGGLDMTTPSLSLQPGALTDGLNFECSQSGGYARIGGYERFDGRASPSAASYTVVQFAAFTTTPVSGDTLLQATTGATGTVAAVVGGATPYVALTKVSGTFDTTHNVTDGGNTVGVPVAQTVSVDAKTNAIYTANAADIYRALIGAVPGSGPIVDVFGAAISGTDTVYALRANAGNTALALYKSSAAGWVLVPFFNTVGFSAGGTATPVDGETLTQGAVTATIKRVMQASGAWTGTAAGQFVVTNPSGGNFAAGAATTTSGATVTLAGAQVAIAPLPGGKGEHVKANFSGQPQTQRVYGCDGVNPPYEFDGTTYAPIPTGLSPNQPTHITAHKNYLVVSQQGSLVGSGPGLPFRFDAASGAWEVATGDTITGMITLPGSQTTATLAVFNRANTSFLYGLDVTSFNFVSFNTGLGALPYSVQNLFDTFVFDDLGVVTLQTTLNWGNFLPSSLTKNLLPFIEQERTKLSCSVVERSLSQYRVFFSDGYGLYLTQINRQYLGAIPVLFPNAVNCADHVDLSTGSMTSYFGSSDGLGYVYEMDKGTSFDGADITAHITLAWDALRSPEILKRFRAASLEVQSSGYASIGFGYQLGYGAVTGPADVSAASGFTAAPNWDSFTWDNFTWDGVTLMPTRVDMTDTAENLRVTLTVGTNYIPALNINSLVYHYTMRRGLRV